MLNILICIGVVLLLAAALTKGFTDFWFYGFKNRKKFCEECGNVVKEKCNI